MIQNMVNSIVLCVAVPFAISAYGEVPDQVSTQPEVSAGKKLEARLLDAEHSARKKICCIRPLARGSVLPWFWASCSHWMR